MKNAIQKTIGISYRYLLKPILFKIDAETVHETMLSLGEIIGHQQLTRSLLNASFAYSSPLLKQTIAGIEFATPIGLAAGFDYTAKLTNVLPALGFGFGTVGTVTHLPYEGNPKPRLGRLPLSKSLLVNKGFKNPGVTAIINKLAGNTFSIPIGISVGKTNITQINTQEQAIADILATFTKLEQAKLANKYYELNISCPNLKSDVDFYEPKHLAKLLFAVRTLNIKKPIFVKMPIGKTDVEFLRMVEMVVKYNIPGIIIGNLQTNRFDPSLVRSEVQKYPQGNFSGKPTQKRSNELIRLTYKHYQGKLIIIGCGGVFSIQDAYQKISLGTSLVQLITGMVYQGPQLVSQINRGLVHLLTKKGFADISEVVGSDEYPASASL